MLCYPSSADKVLPREYRKAAEALFPAVKPPDADARSPNTDMWQKCLLFAEKLGVVMDYRRLEAGWKDTEELEKFLHSFGNNLELLIQKTWVEKDDEDRKEKLLDQVPGFIALIKNGEYAKALGEFGVILEEVAWLLFGSQSREKDFFDYAFRIDHQMGLFWWYGGQLEHFLSIERDTETIRMVLFLGICYLTEF